MSPLPTPQPDVFLSSSSHDSPVLSLASPLNNSDTSLPLSDTSNECVNELGDEAEKTSVARATSERRDEAGTFDEPTLAQSSPGFSPFLTPPHVSTPRSPLSPPSPSQDKYNTSAPSTQVSPTSVSSFSSPSSSPFAQSSFDPVVGGGGGPFKTPTRSRVHTLQRSHVTDAVHASASLPATPSKPSLTSPFFPSDSEGSSSDTRNTWPPHPRLHGRRSNIVGQPSLAEEADSPSKKGKNQSGFDMLTPDNAILDPVRKKGLTTRYVLVEGFDKSSTEISVRNLLHHSCQHLSLVGNQTSRLRSEGAVVLVFHDIRHSVAAVRRLDSGDHFHGQIPGTAHLSARCITRETFEALHDVHELNSLLSKSEGVLVLSSHVSASVLESTSGPLSLLSIFGEIRSKKTIEDKLHVVEYFDDRDAEKAFRAFHGTERNGIRYSCSFEPSVSSTELLSDPAAKMLPFSTASKIPFAPALQRSPATQTFAPFSPVLAPALIPQTNRANLFETGESTLATFSLPAPPTLPHSPPLTGWGARSFESEQLNSFDLARKNIWSSGTGRFGGRGSSFASEGSYPGRSPFSDTFPLTPPLSPQSQTGSFNLGFSPSYAFPPTSNPIRAREGSRSPVDRQGQFSPRTRLPPSYGIVRDDRIPIGNIVNYERIEQGLEVRTTLMLKNIPNKLTDVEVMQFIDEVVGRAYDFFYLRTDYATGCNVGYGFVNFTSTSALLSFCKQRLGTRWNMCNSDKLCVLSFANIQGKASLINHFKNSSVLDQDESRRPKIFVTSGPNAGAPEKFPLCDDPVRKMRSALNAANVGLFPSQKPVFKVTQAFQGMNF
ncbi:hypothetical protein JCM16303_006066 [Sporobolomyces ruberrimus]